MKDRYASTVAAGNFPMVEKQKTGIYYIATFQLHYTVRWLKGAGIAAEPAVVSASSSLQHPAVPESCRAHSRECWGWRNGVQRGGDGAIDPQPRDLVHYRGFDGTAWSCLRPALSSPSCDPFQCWGLGGFRAGFELNGMLSNHPASVVPSVTHAEGD